MPSLSCRRACLRLALLVAAPLCVSLCAPAQTISRGTPGVARAHVVVRLRDLQAWSALRQNHPALKIVPEPQTIYGHREERDAHPNQPEAKVDGAPGRHIEWIGSWDSPAVSASYGGLLDDDTSIPPDTMGAVGPAHILEALNTSVRISDRAGHTLSTTSLDNFFGPVRAAGLMSFDPRVVYDRFNDRWVVVADAGDITDTANSYLLVAISATGDATGSWHFWSISVDPTNATWADFPQVGITKDWIVISTNVFDSSYNYSQASIWALDKSDFYAGGAGRFRRLDDANGFTMFPATTFDNTLGVAYLLENWDGSSGRLRLSTITGPVGSESLTSAVAYPSTKNAWDDYGGGDIAPQSGTTDRINVGDPRIQSVVYRNGAIWAAQNAFLPASGSTRSSVQWWQIAPDGTTLQFGRVDDPSGAIFRAYPSIAVNATNDVLLGYSEFAANLFASAAYSFRNATDSPGTLQSYRVLKAGTASYYKTFGGDRNRWGDYSATVVDPTDDITMWTLQEYATDPFANGDSRWATRWGAIPNTLESVTEQGTRAWGGAASTGAANLSGTAAADTTVQLSADHSAVTVPSTVVVPAGYRSGSFSIATSPVLTDTKVRITGTLNKVSHHVNFTVLAPVLSHVSVKPAAVAGGASATGSVNLTGVVAPTGSVTVSLSSDNGAVSVPPSVTVAAGAKSVRFSATTTSVSTQQVATITATFTGPHGTTTKTCTLTVNP